MALTDAQKAKLIKLGQLAKFKELADAKYQDAISDLSTIRSGAAAGATAYQKPQTGIPATDLATAVQDAITAAGTALQPADIETLTGKVTALENLISADDPRGAIDKFEEIVAFLNGIDATTLDGILTTINSNIAAKYTKPADGIPATDLAQAVQDNLALAATAVQSADIAGLAEKDADAVAGNIAQFDANGNPVDSGHALSEYQPAGNYKTQQSAVEDPSVPVSGTTTALAFIDSISQNVNGEITPTKKYVANVAASTNGVGGNAGLMGAADKEKLDAIDYASDAEVAELFATPASGE